MLLYIDPGTGGMLFTILVGIISAGIYSVKSIILKLRFRIKHGKIEEDTNKIPIVIFSDDKRYWNIFEPICCELNNRGKDVTYLTFSEDDPVFQSSYNHVKPEFIGKNAKAYARLNYLNATIVLSTTPGLDVYQWRRSKNVNYYIHIPHAASDITLYRMFGIDYYDAILLSGEYQIRDIRQLEQLRNLPAKELMKVGIPYMDVMMNKFQQAEEVPSHPRTVLLAPSWGKSAIFSVFGGRIIDTLLKTGYHIIVRPHPQTFVSEKELIAKLMEEYPASDYLEWNTDTDNFSVLYRSDILISDFSGVIFDFTLIFDKPVIYTNPKFDVSQYDAWWLSTPLWTTTALPRIGRELNSQNMESLKTLIDTCLEDSCYAMGRKDVKQETWEYCGEGTERVVDYLLQKYDELTRIKGDK
ncbi:MAG: CDP-glycerol glycerophosphotransferase family protein [Lachnospiraceae bacterium]|nr:CDP-glycerol glycerophosphotransferase family protein [Lachnospiraceae bacterium]